MICCICNEPASGVCRFCGRALCKEHFKQKPIFLTIYVAADNVPKAIAVGDVLFCGKCKPQPSPINMPELR